MRVEEYLASAYRTADGALVCSKMQQKTCYKANYLVTDTIPEGNICQGDH